MKYAERIGRRGTGSRPFHTAISTTFSVEFAAYEQVMLPQLMASGVTNLLVIADERMASMSLSDGSQLPVQLGRDYELISPPVAAGVFHPKIVLQLGRRVGRLFVGSANITAAGLAGNAEVVIELECQDEPSPEREIVRSAWRYLQKLVPSGAGAARDALNWASDRAIWLAGAEPDPVQQLEDGSTIAFLSNDADLSIGQRFVDLVGKDAVDRLIVASPYWDGDLAALGRLINALQPTTTSILVDVQEQEFPIGARAQFDIEFRELPTVLRGRFPHAKVLIASTDQHDHVLVGSANCTTAALGRDQAVGINAEACIYRRLPRDEAIKSLGLTSCLVGDPLDPDELEPCEPAPAIPLAEIASLRPGTFEIERGILAWTQPDSVSGPGALEFLDRNGASIGSASFKADGGETRRLFHSTVEHPEQISFVVVTTQSFTSYPGHVTHRSLLRGRRREVASGGVAKAVAVFEAGEDFDLWMHQAFDELARADLADRQHTPMSIPRSQRTNVEQSQQTDQHLTYDEFMETRSPDRRNAHEEDSTLSGTHSESIRSFLNILSGRAAEQAVSEHDSSDDWMDLGDEDEQGEVDGSIGAAQLEGAYENENENENEEENEDENEQETVDARMFQKMVQTYVTNVTTHQGPLGSSDVLRLRFWLMLLLHKARHPGLPGGLEAVADEAGWPRMAHRVITSFFCGKTPPVTRLMVSREYTEMPVDFLECWTTVLWTLDAIDAATPRRNAQFLHFVQRLRAEVFMKLGLTPAELASPPVVELWQALNRTIGTKLGCSISRPA